MNFTFRKPSADKIPKTNKGSSATTVTLNPNEYYIWGEMSTLTLTLGTASTTYLDEFMFQFDSGSTATTLTFTNASNVRWVQPLTPQANKTYQVSIVNNIGVWVAVDYTSS